MKQILQDLKTSEIQLVEIPTAQVQNGHILIESDASLISKGTEKMLLEFGKSWWSGFSKKQSFHKDKGQRKCLTEFIDAIKNGHSSPVPFDEAIEVTNTSFDILNLRT